MVDLENVQLHGFVYVPFPVSNVSASEQRKGITYNQFIDYNQILDELQKCNTVLEVVQPGQVGVTLRYV